MTGIVNSTGSKSGIIGTTEETFDDDTIKTNIALLAFKTAVNGSLAKYSLQDQIIDEYENATGVDDGPSTNHTLASDAYSGVAVVAPTVTHDADATDVDGDYTWYKWTDVGATGSYSANATADHDFLVIAGGGGGAQGYRAGGGGAGGYRNSYASEESGGPESGNETEISLIASTTYTITVGAGGTGGDNSGTVGVPNVGDNGGVSSITGSDITDITTVGGGGGGGGWGGAGGLNICHGVVGGSGGGGCGGNGLSEEKTEGSGRAGTANQGFAGGDGYPNTLAPDVPCGGGGGGAGAIGIIGGSGGTNGDGGAGLSSSIDGSATTRAGGGGGGNYSSGNVTIGGAGGGGAGGGGDTGSGYPVGSPGSDTTGSGGGGSGGTTVGGDGGNGIVIIRRLTNVTTINNLTLQSIDTTAEAAPTKADMIIRVEDAVGTATINTDIKGFVSRDSGSTFTEGTLVDEGHWGDGTQRILAFHDLSFTGASGTAMCYKITTHNQAVGKQTKIHATSIGWR